MKTAPIFILGIMQRSGTNFLQDLLCLHPDCESGQIIHEDFLAAHTDLLVEYANSVYGNYPSHWKIEEILGPPEDSLCQHLGNSLISFLNLQLAKKNGISRIAFDAYKVDIVQNLTPKRLVTKTPSVKNLQHFFTIFPQAHLLIIIRDGRAVIESGVKSFDWNYEAATHSWANAARTIFRFTQDNHFPNQQYLVVRYEDIHKNTKDEMMKILSFLGLDMEKYDFEAAQKLPIKGSSDIRDQGRENVHWLPLNKTQKFNPMKRWENWGRARHERFNWLAGQYLLQFGYSKQTFTENQNLWNLWNIIQDVKWKTRSRFNKFLQVLLN